MADIRLRPQKQAHATDCDRTALACLLGITRDAIPDFATAALGHPITGDETYEQRAAIMEQREAWLADHGWAIVRIALPDVQVTLDEVMHAMQANNPDVPYLLAVGLSERVGHVVVVMDGEVVCDPDPEMPMGGPPDFTDGVPVIETDESLPGFGVWRVEYLVPRVTWRLPLPEDS